jgi:integrase
MGQKVARRAQNLNRLNVKTIEAFAKDWGGTKALHDGGGLYLRRTSSGKCFWYLRVTSTLTGKETWVAIGEGLAYPQTTLAQARSEAVKHRESVAAGTDLIVQKQEQVAAQKAKQAAIAQANMRAVTFRDVFDQWQATELKSRVSKDGKRHGRRDNGLYALQQCERHVFPFIGDTPITKVKKADVFKVLDARLAAGTQRTANMILADLKQLFRFAADREIIEVNPIASLKKERVGGADNKRDRFLSPDEIPLLHAAMPASRLALRSQLAIWIALATGARVGELMGAVRSDTTLSHKFLRQTADTCGAKFGIVNREAKTWYLPDTKNQRDHTIHLSAFALKQFDALFSLSEHDAWLFPDTSGQKPVCKKSFGKQLADRQRYDKPAMEGRALATDALELPGGRWTAHDLRRTAGTFMAMRGHSGDVVNECLNHVQSNPMSRTYLQTRRENEQKIAFEDLGAYLFELLEGKATDNVIQLKKKGA